MPKCIALDDGAELTVFLSFCCVKYNYTASILRYASIIVLSLMKNGRIFIIHRDRKEATRQRTPLSLRSKCDGISIVTQYNPCNHGNWRRARVIPTTLDPFTRPSRVLRAVHISWHSLVTVHCPLAFAQTGLSSLVLRKKRPLIAAFTQVDKSGTGFITKDRWCKVMENVS